MTQNMFMQDVQTVLADAPELYKFSTFNENAMYSLIDGYLWFSVADKFNDPFEGVSFPRLEDDFLDATRFVEFMNDEQYKKLQADYCSSPTEIRERYQREYLANFLEDMAEFRDFGFCCFLSGLERNELTINQEMMMWGHYSDGLRGFRIIYDASTLIASIPSADIYPINYTDEPPRVNLASYMYETRISPSGPRFRHSFGQNVFTTKHSSWSYEREIRLRRPEAGPCPFDRNAIIGVDFGSKMSLAQIKVIKALLAHLPNQPTYRIAHISPDSYRIAYSPCLVS